MNYETYQPLARRTESQEVHLHGEDLTIYQRLEHAQNGLTTEIIELLQSEDDANEMEELGDIFWYLDLGCSVLGWTMSDLNQGGYKDLEGTSLMLFGLGEFTDLLKRRYYYGKEDEEFLTKAKRAFGLILSGLYDVAEEKGFFITDILEKNIEKLRIRQPGKFCGELAVNRDLEKERQVFTP